MRLLEKSYGKVRIFSDRPFGYKRYHVDWGDGSTTMYSSIWYRFSKVCLIVEEKIDGDD
tara:strand:+ start:2209 stop:2385 length:177 start_codon:yes stop_codon:yes gene_type:complete